MRKCAWRAVRIDDEAGGGIERGHRLAEPEALPLGEDLRFRREIAVQGGRLDRQAGCQLSSRRMAGWMKRSSPPGSTKTLTWPSGRARRAGGRGGTHPTARQKIDRRGRGAGDRDGVADQGLPVRGMHGHGLGEAEGHGEHRLSLPLDGGDQARRVVVRAVGAGLEQQEVECHHGSTGRRQRLERGGERGPGRGPVAEPLQARIVDDEDRDLVARAHGRAQLQPEIEAGMVERPKDPGIVPARIGQHERQEKEPEGNEPGPAHRRLSPPWPCARARRRCGPAPSSARHPNTRLRVVSRETSMPSPAPRTASLAP